MIRPSAMVRKLTGLGVGNGGGVTSLVGDAILTINGKVRGADQVGAGPLEVYLALEGVIAPGTATFYEGGIDTGIEFTSGMMLPAGLAGKNNVTVRGTGTDGVPYITNAINVGGAVARFVNSFDALAAYSDAALSDPAGKYDIAKVLDVTALKANSGRTNAAALKNVRARATAGTLPTGLTYNETTWVLSIGSTFAGEHPDDATNGTRTLMDWDLSDVRVDVNALNVIVTQNYMADTLPRASNEWPGSADALVFTSNFGGGHLIEFSYNTYESTRNMLERRGRGVFSKSPKQTSVFYNRIIGLSGDFIDLDYGWFVERNFVKHGIRDDVTPYDPNTVYGLRSYTTNASGHLFVSLVDGVTGAGSAPPTGKSSNSFWKNFDPHPDFTQMKKADFSGANPATQIARHNYIEFEDDAGVYHFWWQGAQVNADDAIYSALVEGNVLKRPAGDAQASFSVPGLGKNEFGYPVFRGNWVTPTANGVFGEADNAKPLWVNNRNLDTGIVTAVPSGYIGDTPLVATVTGSGNTLTLRFDRTPIAQAGGTITLRQGASVIETFAATAGVLRGGKSLVFTTAAPLVGSYVVRISQGAVVEVAGYETPEVADDSLAFAIASTAKVVAVYGQSDNVVGWSSNETFMTGNDLYPVALPGVDFQVGIHENSSNTGAHQIREVTQATADLREVGPGAVSLGNVWHLGSGGVPLRAAAVAVSGTGFDDALDDDIIESSGYDRNFAADKALVDLAQSTWGPIQRVLYNWTNNESSAAKTLWESRSAHFFGLKPDYTDYDFELSALDHCLIDKTGRGYGALLGNTLVDLAYPGNSVPAPKTSGGVSQFPDSDIFEQPLTNYRYDGLGKRIEGQSRQNSAPAYESRREFMALAPAENRGKVTTTVALTRKGDFEGGVKLTATGNAQSGIHAAMQHWHGQILYGMDMAAMFLIAHGYAANTRLMRSEFAADGSYCDLIFGLPPAANLSTLRLKEGTAVPSPRPHQQEVMGMVIARNGDTEATERPVYRAAMTDDVAYPPAYRGTVVIQNTGADVAGGREGVVRITPTVPFADGDIVRFGWDGAYGLFNLTGYEDYDARLYSDGLRAYEARLDDGTIHGYPGIPVINQESVTASGITAVTPPPASAARVSRDPTLAYLLGPDIGAGVAGITMLFKGKILNRDTTGYKDLLVLDSTGFVLSVGTRPGQRSIQISMEDGGGTRVLINTFPDGSLPSQDTETTILATANHDNGSGTAVFSVYVNGGLLGTVTAPSGAQPFFQTTRNPELLGTAAGIIHERSAFWKAYSPDGSEPTTGLAIDTAGYDAAKINGTGLPAGWSKVGAGVWADV